MNNQQVIEDTVKFIKNKLDGENTGHDWWHVYRVWKLARYIAKKEKDVDLFIVEMGALLHDIADWKNNDGDETAGKSVAIIWLRSQNLDDKIILKICEIFEKEYFKGKYNNDMGSKEGQCVLDADWLDAMGAIGIARGFMFAGNKFLPMYIPGVEPVEDISGDNYKNLNRETYTQINHFYEKLLKLKDLMHTKTGREMAEHRHKFMEIFLQEFFKEWEGEL